MRIDQIQEVAWERLNACVVEVGMSSPVAGFVLEINLSIFSPVHHLFVI